MSDEKPKIIVDEDWKSQVEAEKAAAQNKSADGTSGSSDSDVAGNNEADPPMPPASFQMLVSSLATEAMLAMGQIPHPVTGEVVRRRNQAKYLVDTIEILREKTLGNITAEETSGIDDLLHQLRMAYVAMPGSPAANDPSAKQE